MTARLNGLMPLALGAAICAAAPAHAQEAASVPVRDVVLFSSGVGYFQRSGQITGAASINLPFRAEQVNDILKSLVLFDPAGNVRPVTYTTKDPVGRQLRGAGLAVNQSISMGALLRQFQGARVRLETGAQAVEGRILSVSTKGLPVKDGGVVQVDVVNILTDEGLQAIPLEQVSRVKLLDERLDRELRQSLELLATGLDDQRRNVELHFTGAGAREVRAGYLLEMPVWKTSYRLVLDKAQKPYLQGWAIVENTTDEDWKDVRLSLVSGRPVSFLQDLYQPLYVPRPVVQAQVIGSPLPQTYGEAVETDEAQIARIPRITGAAPTTAMRGPAGPPGPAGAPADAMTRSRGGFGGGFGGTAGGEAADFAKEAFGRRRDMAMSAEMLAKSVASLAQGTERGDLFEYAIQQPVTLAKQKAAMVPIVTTAVDGQRVSIYDPASDAKHALNAIRLKNTTGLHLSGGPVTIYRDGVYAGDSQITNLQPDEDRLLSYAVDLDLVVDHDQPRFRQETLSVSAKSGVLILTRKQHQERLYTLRNKSDEAKTVLVQQAQEADFKLVEPAQPAEKTAEHYRFSVTVPAKQTAKLKVLVERPLRETVALLDADINVLVSHAQNAQVSEKLRGALKQLVERRRKVTELEAQRAALEGELKTIDAEQARIRQNMAQLDRNSPLYQQYVKKLTEQETRIEKLREEIVRLREAEADAQKELRAFVDTLTAE